MDISKERICFLHLSKAGGSTIRHILKGQYKQDEIFLINGWKDIEDYDRLNVFEKERFNVIAGHFGMDFFHRLEGEFCLFSLLRHPVERIISHYHYVRRTSVHEFHANVQEMSMLEYALDHADKDIDNGYVRQLCGVDFDLGQCEEDHLRLAKDNFMNHMTVFGFTERMSESIEKLASRFGWNRAGIKPGLRLNETPSESKSIVSSNDREKIARRNKFDMALYNWATKQNG